MKNINTLNESSLHRTLKIAYAENYDGKMEVEIEKKIYDIVCANGDIIEIQTKNLSKLFSKITKAISDNKKIKIVFPIEAEKYIELFEKNKNNSDVALENYENIETDFLLLSRRKSPVKKSIYNIFFELTKLYSLIGKKGFSIDVVECVVCEKRIKTKEPVQSKNGKRRFKKNWLKADKALEKIIRTTTLKTLEDYKKLLPKSVRKNHAQEFAQGFTTKDISNAICSEREFSSSTKKSLEKQVSVMMWVLERMNVVKVKEIRKRAKVFVLTGE